MSLVDAGKVDALTEHGVAQHAQLVWAGYGAGPPTRVPSHEAGEGAGIGRVASRWGGGV